MHGHRARCILLPDCHHVIIGGGVIRTLVAFSVVAAAVFLLTLECDLPSLLPITAAAVATDADAHTDTETTIHGDEEVRQWLEPMEFYHKSLSEHWIIREGQQPFVRAEFWEDCSARDSGIGENYLERLEIEESNINSRLCPVLQHRGGGQDGIIGASSSIDIQALEDAKLAALSTTLGPDFDAAIQQNRQEHDDDCAKSCELYYCASLSSSPDTESSVFYAENLTYQSHSMGAVPPEDFAERFGFPLDLIKVSQQALLLSEEAQNVIQRAKLEGLDQNAYQSGKYKLGGNWLDHLPQTRRWFNHLLRDVVFPQFHALFPKLVSSPKVLRAHSVSLLKYNVSHPRTDIHIDNGILAFTLAMNRRSDYEGGGTFFEHMQPEANIIEMDVGHATFRPGSIRHGGHKVTSGERYILGCFLLVTDHVEHVRRLKNRASNYRREGRFQDAIQHFQWALAINPKCTTCLKDWAELLQQQGQYRKAEELLRRALEMLEDKDSDALFNLGLVLSEQGRNDEAIVVYRQSIALNPDDAELCYNLGMKLGAKGRHDEEMELYERAVEIEPTFGGAWLNWGTALAESDDLDSAEVKFMQALKCGGNDTTIVSTKAMLNLSILYHRRGELLAQGGSLVAAKSIATQASELADSAKRGLDSLLLLSASQHPDQNALLDLEKYMKQFPSHRIRCHRLLGQLFAGMGDFVASEAEFVKGTESFPKDPSVWLMLGRVQEIQGKEAEASVSNERARTVQSERNLEQQ